VKYYGVQNVNECAVCVIGDNTPLNPCIARKFGISFVGCASHCHNLEKQHLLDKEPVLKHVVTTIHRIIKAARNLKAAAELHGIFEKEDKHPLSSIMYNATRWSGKCNIVRWYFQIEWELQKCENIDKGFFHTMMKK
jgi:hypothetical protein